MPSLSQLKTSTLVKGLYLGDPGSGKTGSLVSLLKAGYKLRIYDFDNLLGSLIQFAAKECPDKMDNALAQTFTDKMKGNANPVMMVGGTMKVMPFVDGQPKAFINAMKQLTHWKTETEDLGEPSSFGPGTVVVIDTLTTLSAAAFRYVQAMNPAAKDQQAYFYSAQQLVIEVLSLLFSEQFSTNVLVLAHVDYTTNHLNIQKGFPRSIGSALNSKIGSYFNCVLLAETVGNKRLIRTNSNGLIDLKCPVSFKLPETLPLESGLATFFEAIRN
ncbi:unnamed protein product [Sphagnum jensenii]